MIHCNFQVLCASNKDKIIWYPVYSASISHEILSGTIKPVIGGINSRGINLYIGKYIDTTIPPKLYYGSVEEDNNLRFFIGRNIAVSYYELLIVIDRCSSKE